MKRVLILNGTSFVGGHVARNFYESHEYEVEVTCGAQDEDLLWRHVRTSQLAEMAAKEEEKEAAAAAAAVIGTADTSAAEAAKQTADTEGGGDASLAQLPPALRRYVTAVVPRHNDQPDEFRRRLLSNDVIVAVLEDDAYEAECALRILRGTCFDVEKTFVLVSSTLTWAHTILAERAKLRAQRRREREAERAAYLRDYGEDEELPEHLQDHTEDDEDDGEGSELDGEDGVPMRTFTEAEYHGRVPHPRYTPWLKLERLAKRANSATLHTYVVFAGVPYGCGEGPVLHPVLRAAWHAQELPLYGPGHNVLPMIHIRDLARIVYKLGDAYDVLEERYFFAVDRGNVTQLQLLQAIERALGGRMTSAVAAPPAIPANEESTTKEEETAAAAARGPLSLIERLERDFGNEPRAGIAYFLSDVRATPEAVFAVHPEEDWHALEGFVAHIDAVCYEFRSERDVRPVRIFLTGPPCSGAPSVAARLAARYGVPHLTRDSVVAEYTAHAEEVRTTLYELLLRRLLRRRTRRYERTKRALEAERARLRAEAAAAAEAEAEAGEEDEEDEGEEGAQTHEGRNAAGKKGSQNENNDGEDNEDREDEEEDDPQRAVSAALSDLIDTACDVASARAKITERYVRGPPLLDAQGKPMIEGVNNKDLTSNNNYDDEDDENEDEFNEDEEMPEEGEEEDDDDDDEELTRAERRARAARAAQDLQERIHMRELRLEYMLARKALSMKLVDGRLPRPPKAHHNNSDDDEEEAEEDNDEEGNNGRASRRNRYGEDMGSEGEDEEQDEGHDEAARDGAEEREEHNDDDEEEEEEEEEGEEEDEGDDEEGADSTTKKKKKKKPADVPPSAPPGHVLYLDEAMAFFMRWRLRQHDCRNQGYVLDCFPETVRQACLLFQTNRSGSDGEDGEAEDEEGHAQRALPPTTVDDVLPPLDADFAFPPLATLDEAGRRKLERAVLQRNPVYKQLIESAQDARAAPAHTKKASKKDRGGGDEDNEGEEGREKAEEEQEEEEEEGDEKDILAAVNEGLFPDYVLILQRTDRQLETIAGQRGKDACYYYDDSSHFTQSFPVQPQYSNMSSVNRERNYSGASSNTTTTTTAAAVVTAQRRVSSPRTDMSTTMPTRRRSSNVVEVRAIPLVQPHSKEEAAAKPPPPSSQEQDEKEQQQQEEEDSAPLQLQQYRRNSSVATTPDPLVATVTPDRGFSADQPNNNANSNGSNADKAHHAHEIEDEDEDEDEENRNMRAMRPVKDTTRFYIALDDYRRHHGCGAVAPAISLVTWFQSVQTGEQRGASGTPVLPRYDPSSDAMGEEVVDRTTLQGSGEDGVGGTNEEGAETARWGPSTTARTARVLVLPLPPPYYGAAPLLSVRAGTHTPAGGSTLVASHATSSTSPTARAEALAMPATLRSMRDDEKRGGGGEEDGGEDDEHGRRIRTAEEVLQEFADRLCGAEAELLPVPHVYGPMSAQLFDESSPAERARLRREKKVIHDLLTKEAAMRTAAEQQVQAKIQEERRMLRGMQVRHGCLDVTEAHKMPMEEYLMTYVLPSLTPVMAQVVKVRPSDPVTTLADLLYEHKRRLSL